LIPSAISIPCISPRGVLLEAELDRQPDPVVNRHRGSARGASDLSHRRQRADRWPKRLPLRSPRAGVDVQNHALRAARSPRSRGVGCARLGGRRHADPLVAPADIAALGAPPPPATAVFMSGLLGQLERSPVPAKLARGAPALRIPSTCQSGDAYAWTTHSAGSASDQDSRSWPEHGPGRYVPRVQPGFRDPESCLRHLHPRVPGRAYRGHAVAPYPHGLLPASFTRPRTALCLQGGYLVHFSTANSAQLVADGEWTVP